MDTIENMIEGIGKMLAKLLLNKVPKQELVLDLVCVGENLQAKLYYLVSEGKINEAENLLFEELRLYSAPESYAAGLEFYDYLNSLPIEFLEANDFTKAEIEQGLSDMLKTIPVLITE